MDLVDLGSRDELLAAGRLTGKLGSLPVLVVWDGGEAFAIEDRCPHLGFPLHRGTTADGMITCHWHHARFDMVSGCALDPWADDAVAFDVEVSDRVVVRRRAAGDELARWEGRLRDGLEHDLTLVLAKAVHALVELPGGPQRVLRVAYEFGDRNRAAGWGAGMTVLTCMANLLEHLAPEDRAAALIHALTFLSGDVSGSAPRFGQPPMGTGQPIGRLMGWYRSFVENRNADGAQRALATALATVGSAGDLAVIEQAMFATLTDHVFVDVGHTLDFTNKAFEALAHLDVSAYPLVTGLVAQTCTAERAEELSEWHHPIDLIAIVDTTLSRLALLESNRAAVAATGSVDLIALAWKLLDEEPQPVADALVEAAAGGASVEELARAVAHAAALRLVRFHVNNDPGDWDAVHHTFTFANGVHQAARRGVGGELLRGVVHGATRVYLDRFLNVPPARLPVATSATVDDLRVCWDVQGSVDAAGNAVWGLLQSGVPRADVIAALGRALVQEDAGFHVYQSIEAGVRHCLAWPEGSDPSALALVGVARYLASQTPTRRELATITRTAVKLRRGESTYTDDGESDG